MNPNEIAPLAPAGFYVAIRVGYAFPMVEHNYLPAAWVREYTVSGLIVHDPAMVWAYRNCGITRWGTLGANDSQGVLELARTHGLNFGAVASFLDAGDAGQRSFGFFFRSDREYKNDEMQLLNEMLIQSHLAHARPRNLTAAELETLSLVKNGLLMKEIACLLGISESAIKQRLKSARVKLNAKTGSQAAARATMLGMI
ncbi:MAG TPA: autoinducer binding domain-containing protein [Amaricoccus sp.]|uniref:helix-turn-helix transcriptional regulator n=1 Tax=Amaricoccus sp. TaxID=1872485 RepID=UPI002B87A922|nr:autoinducer binding domain-containing protein [Amaricoccus sp.]HMQ92893.1 autoinducer binding domain-containing protein [Amaricoccus sp.]HMR52395.1 autoinducer binding domain-containing protein [Amaricoccus sp.]HMR59219.1 autoinducer binding domain-containing protein [Amaricoccus sp.]HMT99316.1 autoinducer binding domain-containing protein [Amaricoccus sp.]